MKRTRRAILGLVGGTVTGALSGCLAPGANGSGDGGTTSPTHPSPHTETDTDDEPPTDTPDGLPGDLDRVDTPPYDITDIECDIDDSGEGDRDPLYLCVNMPAEPSLSFEQVSTRGTLLADEGLELTPDSNADQLYATLLTDADDIDRFETDSGDAYDLAAGTDFESHAVLVVQTGWGSGSILPRLKRIEETEDGIHAFGCYTQPCVYTDDFTARSTVARFERPGTLDSGVVSLTVDPSTRYNVATGEGVVTIDQSE